MYEYKVVHVIRNKDRGGISSIVFPLIKALELRGYNSLLIILGKGILSEDAINKKIKVEVIEKKIKGFDPFIIKDMIRIIRKEKIAMIHTHSIGSNLYGRLVGTILNIPVITTVHADTTSTLKNVFKMNLIGSVLGWLDTLMAKSSDKIIAVSDSLRDKLIERGIRKEKITVISNGIELEEKEIDVISVKKRLGIGNEKVVGIVGRLTSVKNHALFLKSAKVISERVIKVKFLVVGDGPLKSNMERFAEELGIKKDVIFTGWNNEMDQLYKIMDLFVLSSHMEGMPVTLLEAMANNLPVVATKVGGIPEVVEDGKTGLLVQTDDPEAFANAIYSILNNPSKGREMGLMGKDRIKERFTIDIMTDKVAGVYKEVFEKQVEVRR